ncbi:MAG: DNA primase [Bacteroidales bacterium]|nr:DNA primase [Lentimicrobiaceae bacterium]MDD5694456.1 DNA primase [Bacteroidales bacterium]
MIKPDTIRDIVETARIEEVVGDFVSLRKRGANLVGLCPFHNEKTPSFNVSPARGIYKCFGCGKAGNAVNFVMEHEHYSYPDALRYLAKKYNIRIEEQEQTAEELQALNEQESLYHVNTFAQKFFSDSMFQTEEGKALGLQYFSERGFREETLRKFELGYSPEKWDNFTRYALDNGYNLDYLLRTGLTIRSEDGKLYDRFRSRVIFPIHNLTGRVIGFGGRIKTSTENRPKYINSPESDIYNKSKALYGIFFAKTAIIRQDNCYLVEGYTDVISLHQAGIENVVSSSGTSLTTDQIKLIKRFTRNITILYDGDPAGIKASFRGIDMILEEGMNVKIVLFPENEDPDSFVRKNRTSEVEEFIQTGANDFIVFKTNLLLKEAAGDPIKRASLIKEIVQSISLIPDAIFRTVYVKECAAVMNMPEQTLMNELNKILRQNFGKKMETFHPGAFPEEIIYQAEKQVVDDTSLSEYQEKDIIRILLMYGQQVIPANGDDSKEMTTVAGFIVHDITIDDLTFENPVYQFIFDDFRKELETGTILTEKEYVNHPDPSVAQVAISLISTPYELSEGWSRNLILVKLEKEILKEAVLSAVLAFKAKKVDQMIARNQHRLKVASDEEEIMELLQEQLRLKNASREINAKLGRIVTR